MADPKNEAPNSDRFGWSDGAGFRPVESEGEGESIFTPDELAEFRAAAEEEERRSRKD